MSRQAQQCRGGALAAAIDEAAAELVGTRLLETEMRRASHRVADLHQDHVTAFLATLDVFSVTDAISAPRPDARDLPALIRGSCRLINSRPAGETFRVAHV